MFFCLEGVFLMRIKVDLIGVFLFEFIKFFCREIRGNVKLEERSSILCIFFLKIKIKAEKVILELM